MRTAPHSEQPQANAAILLWQTRFRLLLIIAVGGLTLGLHWAGAMQVSSVISARYGADTAVTWFVGVAFAYFIFIVLVALYLRNKGRASTWLLAATLFADVVTFNSAILIATPPEWYERALILSMFSLQLALLYSGWRAAMLNLLWVVAAYLGILYVAESLGGAVNMNESLWTLGVFTLGMSAFVMLQADLSARLAMIVRVFDRAREGVFSLSFDQESGAEPDGITVFGTAYEKMRKELTSLILTDPLTACFNPRGFEQLSSREIARASRNDVGLVVLAMDIDHFKSINDTFGHIAGDDVLRDLGGVLRQTARLSDVVARTGGEEFTILAADTDEQGGRGFAQRLLDGVRSHRFESVGDRGVTISIGIAFARARTENVLEVLRLRADEALYAAKRGGRNQYVVWTPS